VAFRARVGGGLSTSPRFSKDLGVLVDADEVVELCAAIAAVFRDEGNRKNRKKARLKFLVEQWEIPRFRSEVERRLGRELRRAPAPEADPVMARARVHLGVNRQREEGLYYVGIALIGGRTTGTGLRTLADLGEKYGSGRIRTTVSQDVLLLDIPEENLDALKCELDDHGFHHTPGWARRATIACTGIQFCKLAVAATKNHAEELVDYLERTVHLSEPVRISVTGCPNSCGQHHVCDIGLEGAVVTIDGVKKEAFQVFLGGGVGEQESFGRRIGVRVPSDDLGPALARLLTFFEDSRETGESFQAFCLRHTNEDLGHHLTSSLALSH
jgi:sulfite reductase beta subunit-like hemoprotein